MTATPNEYGYTLVQHSGFGYAEKPGFEKGLEIRGLSNKRERNLVEKVGGMLFATYAEADEAMWRMMYPYPDDHKGLYPKFRGYFSDKTIDDLRIAVTIRGPGGVSPF